MFKLCCTLALGLAALGGAAEAQTTWYVDAAVCPGPGSGTLGDPYCSIQDAIVAAAASGDEIIVETGIYNESINLLGKAVTLRSTAPNNPAVVAATILDGTALGTSIITCDSGEGAGTVIDGLTLTNGSVPTGGGMFNSSSSPTVTNCTFSGNTAAVAGGGMNNLIISSPTLTNCTFSDNTANRGGGMFNFKGSNPTVTNCVLWGDSPNEIVAIASTPTVTYSAVQGGFAGTGNINADPLFVDADGPDNIPGTDDDDLRLSPGSPCIDAADNTALPAGITEDLDGNPRFVDDPDTPDTGNRDGINPIVDMGAYEFQGTSSPGGHHRAGRCA
ncbi:MAG: hypothetical protein IH983_05595 [Planctomycetes bacterium]|nr:hypothetical protein [Planctomycetota bacterium]